MCWSCCRRRRRCRASCWRVPASGGFSMPAEANRPDVIGVVAVGRVVAGDVGRAGRDRDRRGERRPAASRRRFRSLNVAEASSVPLELHRLPMWVPVFVVGLVEANPGDVAGLTEAELHAKLDRARIFGVDRSLGVAKSKIVSCGVTGAEVLRRPRVPTAFDGRNGERVAGAVCQPGEGRRGRRGAPR